MNTNFWIWLGVAAVVGGALLLILGMPAGEDTTPLVLENIGTEAVETIEADYWEPAAPSTAVTQQVAYSVVQPQVQPCGNCGTTAVAQAVPVRAPQPVMPVYAPRPAAPSCASHASVGHCPARVPSPCGPTPCSGLSATCGTPCVCSCPLSNPGINRNMPLCVEECTFVQLHTTIPHPICPNVRFEWSTSKGSFLDPTAADPIYYVPTTQFADGEDVWVVVTMTDGSGARYTDQLKLHVVNQR